MTRFTLAQRAFAAAGLAIAASLLASPAWAARCVADPGADRPVIGLALGGGGARGFAHVGVLKYLEDNRIPFHRIAGTSMGSIAGGLAATGMSAREITQVVEDIDWVDVFSDGTDREDLPMRRKADDIVGLYGPKIGLGADGASLPAGFVAGQKILFLFESLTAERMQAKHFDDLAIPYRAIATDIVSGDLVILEEGSLAGAMRASMAVPGAFDPMRIGDRLLVDGGLVRNLPVDVVRDLGAEVVIAVNVGTPLRTADEIGNALTIVEQMTSLAIVANTDVQIRALAKEDVLITPRLGNDITSASFDSFTDAFALGYAAALDAAESLQRYAVSEAEYAAWKASLAQCLDQPARVDFVRLNNQSRFSDEVLQELITLETGQPLDLVTLDENLRQIYGLGFIRLATYELVTENGRQGVEITVQQDIRGADFIETGLSIAGSGRGSFINLQLGYLKTDLDERGSEFRIVGEVGDNFGLLTDIYKYLDDGQRWSLNPMLFGTRRDLLIFEDGQALSSARVTEHGGAIQLGREFGRYAQLQVGLLRSAGDAKVDIGQPQPRGEFDAGEVFVNALWDRLDDLYLPTRGARLRLAYIRSDQRLGADASFEQALFSYFGSLTFGRHNALGFATLNTTLSGETPVYALFTGGGFMNMSGFEPNELVGPHFGALGAGYRYQVVQSGFMPGYVGGTVEYGNASREREDVFGDGILNGSLYFGYDTPLGPLYVGYGWNDDRRGLIFLRLGGVLGGDSISRR
ncbi:MAG: patatin-like phospholipase family protein [Xanthomonadales bacterium]|jgi:NTE family protein|nr:patatin-like phospholipase family protein [Xanthomonadales bacterium]